MTIMNDASITLESMLTVDPNSSFRNVKSKVFTKFLSKGGNAIYQSNGEEHFYGSGGTMITGTSFTGSSYLGKIYRESAGFLQIVTSIDCDQLIWSSDGIIPILNPYDTITIKSSLPSAVAGYNDINRFVVLSYGSVLRRAIDSVGGSYHYPLGRAIPGIFIYNAVFKSRDFTMIPTSLGGTGAAMVEAKLLDTVTGTVNYSSTIYGVNNPIGGICTMGGTNGQMVEFQSISKEGWTLSGPNDYEYHVIATQANPTPPGTLIRRVAKKKSSSPDWQTDIENVVGSLASAFCEYSDWSGTATKIPGGTYKGFGSFALIGGSTSGLPVELIGIRADAIENEFIKISWATALEINNDGFIIERSTDGIQFDSLGFVDGHDNATIQHDYVFDDRTAKKGITYYYRLKQIDNDGAFAYTPVVSAELIPEGTLAVRVYPNPTTDQVFVELLGVSDPVQVAVYDAIGQKITEEKDTGPDFIIPMQQLADGAYLIRITSGKSSFTKRIVKQTP